MAPNVINPINILRCGNYKFEKMIFTSRIILTVMVMVPIKLGKVTKGSSTTKKPSITDTVCKFIIAKDVLIILKSSPGPS